jgi:hypothetical protein
VSKFIILAISFCFVTTAFADDAVQAIGGNCAAEAVKQVVAKYKVSKKKSLQSLTYSGDESVFTLGFGKPDDDCQWFYDVKIKSKYTISGKDDQGQPTRKAVTCEILEIQPNSDPMDCG